MGVKFKQGYACLTRWDAAEFCVKNEKGLKKLKSVVLFFKGLTVKPKDVDNFINNQKRCSLVTKLIVRNIDHSSNDTGRDNDFN